MIYKDSIYFSIATHINFKKEYELTYDIIKTISCFFDSHTDISLMFNYIDNSGVKMNKITEKNKDKLYQKLIKENVFQFMIAEHMTSKEYYDTSENQRIPSSISCTIDFMDYSTNNWGISVSIPTEYMLDEKNITEFYSLFKQINKKLNGFNSFISRGSCFPTFAADSLSIFDSIHYSHQSFWNNCVRGYYWGCVINPEIVDKIGGIEYIESQNFYKVEKWQDNLYIQATEDLLKYSLEDAKRMRTLLFPAFPPQDMKKTVYESADDYYRAKSMNIEYFMVQEDLF